jgi:hypothetical protein
MFCCFLCCCKQKVSQCCMSFYSLLLFLAAAFTIYVSVCLFLNAEPLGGMLKADTSTLTESGSTENANEQLYFNSYIHMFVFVSGVSGLIVSLLGCCTSRVSDRCCVMSYTVLLLAFFGVFAVFGLVAMSIHLQSNEFVKSYCQNSDMFAGLQPETESSVNNFFIKIAKEVETGFFQATVDTFSDVDRGFQDHLSSYMCRAQCPCDSRGLIALSRWSPAQIKRLSNNDVYNFEGWYTNFYDCYQDLVKNNIIRPEDRISDKSLMFIQDFEKNLNCAGMCKTPDFWFYKDFFVGPPKDSCLISMKDEFDKADGLLGYSFVAMAVAVLL